MLRKARRRRRVCVLYTSKCRVTADTSNANFTIFRPELTLVSPVGGEQWVTGTSYSIQLARVDHPQTVTVKLNRSYPNGGWETIASNVTANSVNWTASGAATTNARLRIESSVYCERGRHDGRELLDCESGCDTHFAGRRRRVCSRTRRDDSLPARAGYGCGRFLNRNYPCGKLGCAGDERASRFVCLDCDRSCFGGLPCEGAKPRKRRAIGSFPPTTSRSLQPTLAFTSPVVGDTLAIGVPNPQLRSHATAPLAATCVLT